MSDDEMEVGDTGDERIKENAELPKIIKEIKLPEVTSKNGVCGECKLSRKDDSSNQSEDVKSSTQQTTRKTEAVSGEE